MIVTDIVTILQEDIKMSDMAELFARDPLKHTRESIDSIIVYYREARKNFALGEKSAGSTKKMKAVPKADGPKLGSDDLMDLMNKVQE